MTEKKEITIDDPKSETLNSSMTPRMYPKDEDGPNDEFVDRRASNEYDGSEEFSTFKNVQLLAAKKKAEVAAEQSEITPILLEKQATSVIECIAECAEEGKDRKKKNFGDELDDKSNFLIKCLCMIEDLFKNNTRYGIDEKDFYSGNLQFSRNSKQEFKVLRSIKDTIREKEADINHPKQLEDVVSTYIRETIKSDDLTRSLNEKNVDGASREPSVIQKEDEKENEGFCHMSGCDSGISERGSLQGFINQEYVHNEHREEEEDDNTHRNDDIKSEDLRHSPCANGRNVGRSSRDHDVTPTQDVTESIDTEKFCHMSKCDSGFSDLESRHGFTNPENDENEHCKGGEDDKTLTDINGPLQDDPTSEDLDQNLDTNPKGQGRDSDRVQKKDVQENRHTSQVTTCDSGFSDREHLQNFANHEDNDSAYLTEEEDDESEETRAEFQSVDPAPNLNPDDKMTGVGDQRNTENQDGKGDSTSVILGACKAHDPQKQMSAKRDQGHLLTKEISTKQSALRNVPGSDTSVLGSLQDRKGRKDQETRHHKEQNDDSQNGRDNRRPVLLDPDPNLSTTCTKRDRSTTGYQGRVEAKPPVEKEDISHATSCDSDILNLASVRPPELTSQKDCDSSECPKDGKVDVTNKNDEGQRMYSEPDSELICTSLGDLHAEGDPIPERSKTKIGGLATLIKTGYLRVPVSPVPFLFVITFIFTPAMSALNSMNPGWYKEGDNAIIYFSFESYDAESTETIWNARMESMQLPFYSNGIIPDGFKDESQIGRFSVSVDSDCIQINITGFQREDEDEYIVTQILLQGDGSRDRASWNTELKFLPPAQCSILNGSSLIFVQCSVQVDSPETALYCFQGISFFSPYPRGDIADGQAEFRMKNSGEPIRCCSKAQVDPLISISANHETCHDFIWPPTMLAKPASAHDQDDMAASAKGVNLDDDDGTTPYQTTTHTPSSCSRLRNVPNFIISLVLSWFFLYLGSDRI